LARVHAQEEHAEHEQQIAQALGKNLTVTSRRKHADGFLHQSCGGFRILDQFLLNTPRNLRHQRRSRQQHPKQRDEQGGSQKANRRPNQ